MFAFRTIRVCGINAGRAARLNTLQKISAPRLLAGKPLLGKPLLQRVFNSPARWQTCLQTPIKRMMSDKPPAQGNVFKQVAGWYNGLNEAYPLVTKMFLTAAIVGTGDVMCQLYVEDQTLATMDKTRFMRMCFLGSVLIGPTLHFWYGFLYRTMPGTSWAIVLKRVAADQLLFAPAFMVAFFTSLFALEGRIDQLIPHLKENYVASLQVNWMMWIPAQLFNFTLIPPQHAVMFANFIALFWNTYLSWQGHKPQDAVDDVAEN